MLLEILKRPHLGTYVRRLELSRSAPREGLHPPYPMFREISIEPEDRESLLRAIRAAGIDGADEETKVLNMLLFDQSEVK